MQTEASNVIIEKNIRTKSENEGGTQRPGNTPVDNNYSRCRFLRNMRHAESKCD